MFNTVLIDNGSTTESLREQVMIAQFQGATGCTRDQARQLLQNARWEFQTALSMFFQECTIQQQPTQHAVAMVTDSTPTAQSMQHFRNTTGGGHLGPACAPCNTPATPPNFPEALLALQKLQAGGAEWSSTPSPPMNSWQQQQQTPKVLASFNPMPPPSDRYFQSCDWPTTVSQSTSMDYAQKSQEYASQSNSSMTPIPVDTRFHNPFYLRHPSELMSENSPISSTISSTSNAMVIEGLQ